GDAAPGVVDDLVGTAERARRIAGVDAADGVEREHAPGAGLLQRSKVGAVVDAVRGHAVALTMARQEADPAPGQGADADRPGRRAKARAWLYGRDVLQLGQGVDAGPADDGQVHAVSSQGRGHSA